MNTHEAKKFVAFFEATGNRRQIAIAALCAEECAVESITSKLEAKRGARLLCAGLKNVVFKPSPYGASGLPKIPLDDRSFAEIVAKAFGFELARPQPPTLVSKPPPPTSESFFSKPPSEEMT